MKSKMLVPVLSAFLLVGCAPKEQEVSVVNPIHEVSYEEQMQMTGIGLEPLEGAENVVYTVIDVEGEDPISQIEFVYEGNNYCYRAQSTQQLETYDMSGLYYDWTEEEGSIQNRDCKVFINEEASFIEWLDIVPGVNYNLSVDTKMDAQDLIKVADLIFKELQGEN